MFELAYNTIILNNNIVILSTVEGITAEIVGRDTTRAIEMRHVELELANARDALIGNQSELRNDLADLKQRFRLNEDDVIEINPVIEIIPLDVDRDQAIEYGFTLKPSMRLWISKSGSRKLNSNTPRRTTRSGSISK